MLFEDNQKIWKLISDFIKMAPHHVCVVSPCKTSDPVCYCADLCCCDPQFGPHSSFLPSSPEFGRSRQPPPASSSPHNTPSPGFQVTSPPGRKSLLDASWRTSEGSDLLTTDPGTLRGGQNTQNSPNKMTVPWREEVRLASIIVCFSRNASLKSHNFHLLRMKTFLWEAADFYTWSEGQNHLISQC